MGEFSCTTSLSCMCDTSSVYGNAEYPIFSRTISTISDDELYEFAPVFI